MNYVTNTSYHTGCRMNNRLFISSQICHEIIPRFLHIHIQALKPETITRRLSMLKSKVILFLIILAVTAAFILNILGLMKMLPLIITSPLLFVALLILVLYINERRRFKGF